ncbi:MAG TPA: 3-hydroxyacyl-CoA dehydrogenase NAD-binding domain-containing protein [Devosia sp.]|nr:3-hydroxyacyl-CoA dehydrogenase NAD-binding domain-containing protein [Devosia sp.]
MKGRIACIGAGTVGHAWAVVFARAGHEVALFDAKAGEVSDRALPAIRRTLGVLAEGGMLEEPEDTVASRITEAASIDEAVADAVYVQESVREDLATKRQVLTRIGECAPPEAIIASSTSAIRGSEFLTHIPEPGRALVAHPVNPPSLIPLVELCGSGSTSAATIEAARGLLVAAGMTPVVVRREIDGFLLNRLQYTLVAEALHLVGEGYCSVDDIDRVITDGLALRWAFLGPFAVAHLNAAEGFQGFVDRLGPMMRRMGEDARTGYQWTDAQVAEIHRQLAARRPVAQIPQLQRERDRNILALRRLKGE